MSPTPFRNACAKFFRFAAWIAMIVFILISSAYVYLDRRADRRWAEAQFSLKVEGETLKFADLLPPRLPEAENYAAIPEFRGISLGEQGDDKKGVSGAQRRTLLELVSGLEKITPKMYQGALLGRPPNWSQIAAELKLAQYIADLPPLGKEAEVFKKALETRKPLIKILSESSRLFQDAEWVPALRDRTLPRHLVKLEVPHYNAVQMTCKALALHGIAAAESGTAQVALDDYRAICLLTKALGREPLLIGHLLSLANSRYGFEIVWSLLRQRGLQEADLASLQAFLTAFRPEETYLLSLRGELITGLSSLDALATDPTRMGLFSLAGVTDDEGGFRSWLGRAVPDSFFIESSASLVELQMDHFIRPMKGGGLWAVIQQQSALSAALGGGRLYEPLFDRFLARFVLPPLMMVAQRTLQVEVLRRQAIVACALERYFIKQGRYPGRLGELVPQFLTVIPQDPTDFLPLRYRKAKTGRYHLWCVGMDGVDDDGKVNPGPGDNPASPLSRADYLGDWTWQYESVEIPPSVPAPASKGSRLPPLPGFPRAPARK